MLLEAAAAGDALAAHEHARVPLSGPARARHLLVVGGTGSGKTYGIGFPLLKAVSEQVDDSIVWVNPRGPIGTQEVIATVRDGGRRVRVVVFAPGDRTRSAGFNILRYAREKGQLGRLTEAVIGNGQRTRDSVYWSQVAENVLTPMLGDAGLASLADVAAVLASPARFEAYARASRDEELAGFLSFLENGSQNAATNLADIRSRVHTLAKCDQQRATVSGAHELDPEVLLAGGERFLIVIEANESEFARHREVINTFLAMFLDSAVRVAERSPGNRLPRSLSMFIDEFGTIGVIDGFTNTVNSTRSRGIHLCVMVQTLEQLAVYGDQRGTLLAGLTNKIFMLSELPLADRHFAAQLRGNIEVERWIESESWDPEKGAYVPSGRMRQRLTKPLLSSDDLIRPDHPVYGKAAVYFFANLPAVLGHPRAVWDLPHANHRRERAHARRHRRTRREPLPLFPDDQPVTVSEEDAGSHQGPDAEKALETVDDGIRKLLETCTSLSDRIYLSRLRYDHARRPAELAAVFDAFRTLFGGLDRFLDARVACGSDRLAHILAWAAINPRPSAPTDDSPTDDTSDDPEADDEAF